MSGASYSEGWFSKRPKGVSLEAFTVTFSHDGIFLLGGGGVGMNVWEINSGLKSPEFKFGKFNDAAYSPDGTIIATAGYESVSLWDAKTGEIKRSIKEFSSNVYDLDFSPDGKIIATVGEIDSSKSSNSNGLETVGIQLWNVKTGKEIERFGGQFRRVAFSPDGKFIAAGTFDGKVYVRDNQTKELKKFEGHTDTVNSIKFAKDANGKLLVVSGSSDSTVRIWDAATGEEICALVTFRDGNWAVVQTKTGRYDAPNGGEIDGIQWVYGTETIALNQLKDIYYTPNLLPRLLGYNSEPLRPVPAFGKT